MPWGAKGCQGGQTQANLAQTGKALCWAQPDLSCQLAPNMLLSQVGAGGTEIGSPHQHPLPSQTLSPAAASAPDRSAPHGPAGHEEG